MSPGAEDAVALEHIVGDHHWPNLTTLLLHNFKCREHELTTLLEKHAGTLQNLSLRNVTFLESAPRSCFEAIAGKLPQLQRVSLRGRFKAHEFRLRHEADIYMSNVSHRARSDPQTRNFQKYLITGGQFPAEILKHTGDIGYDELLRLYGNSYQIDPHRSESGEWIDD